MAISKAPNLCGLNTLQDDCLNKFDTLTEDVLTQVVGAADANASAIVDSIKGNLTPLTNSLKQMIPELPSVPNINFQSELKSLQSLVVGSAQYVAKLATIKSQFGSLIDLDSLDLTTVDACSLDNLTLQAGKVISQASDITQSIVKGVSEKAPTQKTYS